MKLGILLILSIFFLSKGIFGQSNFGFDQLPIRNFTRNNYKSGHQNWGIAQGKNGMMYFANNDGLLIFNGNSWKLYTLPNNTIVRSVATDGKGRIYIGSFEEFGYFEQDQFGSFHYTSLLKLLGNYNFHNEEIWKIIIHNNGVYFQAFTEIFKFHNNKIETLNPNGFVNSFSKLQSRLIINIQNKGLFELTDSVLKEIDTSPFFTGNQITNILQFNKDYWLITTLKNGVYLYNEQKGLSRWNSSLQKAFKNDQINRAIVSNDGEIILGTILNGVYILNIDGSLLYHINKYNGLQNNTVLALFTDLYGDVWLGLDRGIDLLIRNSDVSFYHDFSGKIGSVYTLQMYSNKLFVGTNQGLYSSQLKKEEPKYKSFSFDFSLLNKSQGQVWTLYNAGNQLLCGHNQGTFDIQNDQMVLISDITGGLSFDKLTHNGKNYLLGSTYTALVLYEKKHGKWQFRNTIEGFIHPIKQIKTDYLGNIWGSHFVKGLFKLKLNDSLTRVEVQKSYGRSNGFKSDYNIKVTRIQNRVIFINNGKLYTYTDLTDSIVPYLVLEEQIGRSLNVRNITQAQNNDLWVITDTEILYLHIKADKWVLKKVYSLELFYDKLISGEEFVLPESEHSIILALNNGLACIKYNETVNQDSTFLKPLLNKVTSNGRTEIQLPLSQSDKEHIPSLAYHNNNLEFGYSIPLFRNPAYFLLKLEGLENEWIETTRSTRKYDRLPAGKYTFYLKAIDAEGKSSDTIKWSFSIKPPWYASSLIKVFYIVILLALFVYIRIYYKKRLKYLTKKMKIEKERELIKLRNEKLEAEIKHKSKELANTTFLISKKNELLIELRKMLSLSKRQSAASSFPAFKKIIRIIDRNISNEDDWKVFESNFERAHDEFLKRIREKFPELSPGDLKLCAYLRMNLSSKKIALLQGITVRGVENHRYRLRKKIGLDHNDNLLEFMIKF